MSYLIQRLQEDPVLVFILLMSFAGITSMLMPLLLSSGNSDPYDYDPPHLKWHDAYQPKKPKTNRREI